MYSPSKFFALWWKFQRQLIKSIACQPSNHASLEVDCSSWLLFVKFLISCKHQRAKPQRWVCFDGSFTATNKVNALSTINRVSLKLIKNFYWHLIRPRICWPSCILPSKMECSFATATYKRISLIRTQCNKWWWRLFVRFQNNSASTLRRILVNHHNKEMRPLLVSTHSRYSCIVAAVMSLSQRKFSRLLVMGFPGWGMPWVLFVVTYISSGCGAVG